MVSSSRRFLFALVTFCCFFQPLQVVHAFNSPSDIRQEWINRSVSYYSKIMREERRKNMGQIPARELATTEYQQEFQNLAKKHYFALRKIKEGQYEQAEILYKRIIKEIVTEEAEEREGGGAGQCDHAKLAVTTLLLALHCQRMGDLKKTRSVFLSFFRVVVVNSKENGGHQQCACSAKVLGAFALFEMKQGNAKKSLEIAKKAVEFDPALQPVLNWKQFRDVQSKRRQNTKLHP